MSDRKCGYIYTNSSGLNVQDTSVNLAEGFPGRERVGPEVEEDGLRDGLCDLVDGLGGLEEELAKLHVLRGAPLAQCEESSI